jgi:hypothetical protein
LTTVALLAVSASPLAGVWFAEVSGLSSSLTRLASASLWLAILLPALSVLQSWYQGILVHSRRTRGITESMVIYLAVASLVQALGIWNGRVTGLHVAVLAMLLGSIAQVGWLKLRVRSLSES